MSSTNPQRGSDRSSQLRRRPRVLVTIGIAAGAAIVGSLLVVATLPRPGPDAEASADEIALAALTDLRAASTTPVEVHFDNGSPDAVRARVPVSGADPVERALDYLSSHRALYGLDEDVELTLVRVRRIGDGAVTAVAFGQSYRGVPVLGAGITIPVDVTTAYGSGGALRPNIAVETTPAIDEAAAVAFALDETGAIRGIGRPELVIFDPSHFMAGVDPAFGPGPRLAWRLRTAGAAIEEVLVDAMTPALLLRTTVGAEDAAIQVSSLNNETVAEDEFACAELIRQFDPADPDFSLAIKLFDDTLDWYALQVGWDSWDGDDADVIVHIDAMLPTNVAAHWTSGCELWEFADGALLTMAGAERWDLVVHEFQHAVTGSFVDLVGAGLPGAMNEGFSDVFAMLVTGTPKIIPRNTVDPDKTGHPDRLSEMYSPLQPCGPQPPTTAECKDDPPWTDDGWEHANSTLIAYPAVLMYQGGTHPENGITVTAANKDHVRDLWWQAIPFLQFSAGSLHMLRWSLEFIADSSDLYADTRCSVRNAFAAIEVGPADQDCNGVPDQDEDEDGDGILESLDNCPGVSNTAQGNFDQDDFGDVCDPDIDGDGIPDKTASGIVDNCPYAPNPSQGDQNVNQVGTACDPTEDDDFDNDGTLNDVDNCPLDANTLQLDVDHDGEGDVCDPDGDGDGISTNDDNCPGLSNADQADADADGIGDPCDRCPDAADSNVAMSGTVIVTADGTEHVLHKAVTPDSDGDGTPDACDRDISGSDASLRLEGAGITTPSDRPTRSDLILAGDPGGAVAVLIPLCEILCIQPLPDDCVEARLSGIDATTRVSILDGDGDRLDTSRGAEDASLRISPTGASAYELYFERLNGSSGEDRISLEIDTCSLGERGGGPAPSTAPTAPSLPTFGPASAAVSFTVGDAAPSLDGGRCAVAELDGYAFSVSAGTLGGGDFIAVAANQVALPLGGSWEATITGSAGGTAFATFSGLLTFDGGGTSGTFSGQSSNGEAITGSFTC